MEQNSNIASIFNLCLITNETVEIKEDRVIAKAHLKNETCCPKCGGSHLQRTTRNN